MERIQQENRRLVMEVKAKKAREEGLMKELEMGLATSSEMIKEFEEGKRRKKKRKPDEVIEVNMKTLQSALETIMNHSLSEEEAERQTWDENKKKQRRDTEDG